MPLLQAHNLPANMEVIPGGGTARAMFFIASGKVRMRADGTEQEYGTGEFFGATALLENDISPGQFTTTTKCRVLKLFKEDFHRLENLHPQIAAHIRNVARSHGFSLPDIGREQANSA
jgi:voltage-gated potassium channel